MKMTLIPALSTLVGLAVGAALSAGLVNRRGHEMILPGSEGLDPLLLSWMLALALPTVAGLVFGLLVEAAWLAVAGG